ncbi:hypothetical protein [Agaribacter marinus]|uniref:hypothetical protein n=1 Tax=Agaribacter marinus TaxID=1431249 RepID=UPI0024E176E5|nr:hypothetical protein [Agaribacter marinus]
MNLISLESYLVVAAVAPPKINIDAANVKDFDYLVLAQLLGTATSDPEGHLLYQVKHNLKEQSHKVDLSVIRLERVGYIEKRNDSDINGNEYYTHNITHRVPLMTILFYMWTTVLEKMLTIQSKIACKQSEFLLRRTFCALIVQNNSGLL